MPQRDVLLYIIILAWLLAAYILCAQAAPMAIPHKTPRSSSPLPLTAQQDSFNFTLLPNYLPRATTAVTALQTLPAACLANTECAANIVATNVTFSDCGSPWTICRCEGGTYEPVSLDTAVDRLARIPVGLRRYIATIMLLGDDSPHAYTLTTGEIHFFGDIGMDGWLHEATHTFDFYYQHTLSSSQDWLDAIGNDTCAPDSYSLTNAVEDFAQVGVMKFYTLAHYGALPLGWETECMQNQLKYMDSLPLFNKTTLFGTCDMTTDGAPHQEAPPPFDQANLAIPLSEDSNRDAGTATSTSATTAFASPTRSPKTSDSDASRQSSKWCILLMSTLLLIVLLAPL
ncbi:hypothetical protein BDZ89DRAFT_1166288 [Hymenopellis radicata]|nr:hypothetical protein BDZ89DRAFT_1166288 [Hymenopellis radicata]